MHVHCLRTCMYVNNVQCITPPPPPPPHFSWGEEIWGHSTGSGDIVCTGEECGQTLTTNPLQPLPQDQRETGRNQQHTHAWCQVSTAPCACVLAWNPLICMHFAPLHSFPDVTIIKGVVSKLLHVNWLKAWSNNQFLSWLAWSELYSYMYVNMNPLTWPCIRYMCMQTHTHTHTHTYTHTHTHTLSGDATWVTISLVPGCVKKRGRWPGLSFCMHSYYQENLVLAGRRLELQSEHVGGLHMKLEDDCSD